MTFEKAKQRLDFLAGTNDHCVSYAIRTFDGKSHTSCDLTLWQGPQVYQGSGKTWEIAFADLAANMAGPDPTEAPDAEGATA